MKGWGLKTSGESEESKQNKVYMEGRALQMENIVRKALGFPERTLIEYYHMQLK